MRILQLTVHFHPNFGGVETHLNDLVKELTQRGIAVFVLTYLPLTAKVKAAVWETGKNLKILRLPWIAGFFYKLVKNPMLEFAYLAPPLFLVTPLTVILFRPDVIHTHGLIAGAVGVFWGKVFGIRNITTTHSIYHFPKNGLYRSFVKRIFENSSKILTLSRQSKKEVVNLGIDERQIQVFTYWIDLQKFKPVGNKQKAISRKKLGWQGKFMVLFVGRLVKEKGVLVLLESLKSWDKNIYLAIVGTGPLESVISEQKAIYRNLMFLGKIENDKLPLYYSSADLVIVPSIHDEGFGRVILESLASGTPVIAANRGAIPEAMDESVGKLIEVSSQNITTEINNFYKKPEMLYQLSEKSAIYAREKFSDKNVETILESYEETS